MAASSFWSYGTAIKAILLNCNCKANRDSCFKIPSCVSVKSQTVFLLKMTQVFKWAPTWPLWAPVPFFYCILDNFRSILGPIFYMEHRHENLNRYVPIGAVCSENIGHKFTEILFYRYGGTPVKEKGRFRMGHVGTHLKALI